MSAPMNIQHRRTPSNYYAPQPTHARSLSGQFGSSWSDAFEYVSLLSVVPHWTDWLRRRFSSHSPLNSALHLGASSPPMGSTHLSSSYSSMTTSALGLSSTSMCAPLSMSCSPGTAQKDYFSFERDYVSSYYTLDSPGVGRTGKEIERDVPMRRCQRDDAGLDGSKEASHTRRTPVPVHGVGQKRMSPCTPSLRSNSAWEYPHLAPWWSVCNLR